MKRYWKMTFMSVFILFFLFSFSPKSHAAAIVDPYSTYTYEAMTNDVRNLANKYPNLIHYESLGKTKYGREIWAFKLGNGANSIFINGSHHAREWLTSALVMEMAETYAGAYAANTVLYGYPVKSLLDEVSIWFVPMVNPDGVTLQQKGLNAFPASSHSSLISMNNGSRDFTRWKANAEGIDLNRQYPADWATIRGNVGKPWHHNFKGYAPLSANESRAVANFTYRIDPEISVSYHSSGEILYWNFKQRGSIYTTSHRIAKDLSAITGYALIYPGNNPSGGGHTDWFIQEFKRPAFTPEIGQYAGDRHLPISAFNRAWNQNKTVPLKLLSEAKKLGAGRYNVVNDTYSLLTETNLYSTPNNSGKTTYRIKPQQVYVYAKKGDWLQIETWLGRRWIKAENAVQGKIEAVDETITLTETTALYSSPSTASSKQGALGAQSVKANAKVNEWYRITTWKGDLWIKPANAIIGKIVAIDETITLTETTTLYSSPSTASSQQGALGAQSVKANAKVNEWYRITTWKGDLWIKPANAIIGKIEAVDETITLTETTTLYSSPSTASSQQGALGAQSVKANAKVNEWYRITTWKGDLWITPVNAIFGKIELVDEEIMIVQPTTIYAGPDESTSELTTIAPKQMKANAKMGDWYRISLLNGYGWLKLENTILADEVETINETILIKDDTKLFTASSEKSEPQGSINAQHVQAIAKWNDWYQINTWQGPLWIHADSVIEESEEEISD